MQATYVIEPKVHRALYQNAVKKLLVENLEDYSKFLTESGYSIMSDLVDSRLLDKAIDDSLISIDKVNEFLINEINYGLQRNLYIYYLADTTLLEDELYVTKSINSLSRYYSNCDLVNGFPFVYKISMGTDHGKTELIYADVTKEDSVIKNISLVFSKGITYDGAEVNYYIGVEINVELKTMIIKLRGKEGYDGPFKININELQNNFKINIINIFNLESINTNLLIQKVIYNMTRDLTDKVLSPTMTVVNSKMASEVQQIITQWNKLIIDEEVELTTKDINSIKESILNNYYRLHMQHVIGKIPNKTLVDKYEVDGYVRTVKFVDDTIGEGKAKSHTKKESLLDTSVYYDIKSRLDDSKVIKYTTIYWINMNDKYEPMGTSFHAESNGRFKCNVLPYYFDKEVFDYVLRKIVESKE